MEEFLTGGIGHRGQVVDDKAIGCFYKYAPLAGYVPFGRSVIKPQQDFREAPLGNLCTVTVYFPTTRCVIVSEDLRSSGWKLLAYGTGQVEEFVNLKEKE